MISPVRPYDREGMNHIQAEATRCATNCDRPSHCR